MTSENKVTRDVLIPETPKIFYESLTGQYFRSDFDTVKKVIDEIKELVQDGKRFVPLNEHLSRLGLSPIKCGDELGCEDFFSGDVFYDLRYIEDNNEDFVIYIGYTYDPLEVKMKQIQNEIQDQIY